MVSLLVEDPLLHTPEASYVHWPRTVRREIPNFVIEHHLVSCIILYGPRNCKARRTSLGVKDPIAVCRKQETSQAGGKIETQLSPKQAERKVKEIWRKDQYQE